MADGRPPSMNLGKSKETSEITMGGTIAAENAKNQESKPDQTIIVGEDSKAKSGKAEEVISTQEPTQSETETVERPVTSSGWLGGWLGYKQAPNSEANPSLALKASDPAPEPTPDTRQTEPEGSRPSEDSSKPVAPSSWFGLWSTGPPSADEPKAEIPVKTTDGENTIMQDAPTLKPAPESNATSSWAFWSTDISKKDIKASEKSIQSGQLAVTGQSSQARPEPAKSIKVKDDKKGKSSKRSRPLSMDADESSTKTEPVLTKAIPSQPPAPANTAPPNLLMPSVRSTYRLVENPSILQQIARLLLHGQQQPVKHVFLAKECPRIKKALAIGIHGLFPAPLLRTVIGQPTGTSIRFANHAAAAIRRWGDAHDSVDCEIEKVALEGEGKIADRVDNLCSSYFPSNFYLFLWGSGGGSCLKSIQIDHLVVSRLLKKLPSWGSLIAPPPPQPPNPPPPPKFHKSR